MCNTTAIIYYLFVKCLSLLNSLPPTPLPLLNSPLPSLPSLLFSCFSNLCLQGAGKFFVGAIDGGEDIFMRTAFGVRGYPEFRLCSKELMYSFPDKVGG
jgi:hypothetical protein